MSNCEALKTARHSIDSTPLVLDRKIKSPLCSVKAAIEPVSSLLTHIVSLVPSVLSSKCRGLLPADGGKPEMCSCPVVGLIEYVAMLSPPRFDTYTFERCNTISAGRFSRGKLVNDGV